MRAFRARGLGPIYKVELDGLGNVLTHVRGEEHSLGVLSDGDGWLLGVPAFEELEKEGK